MDFPPHFRLLLVLRSENMIETYTKDLYDSRNDKDIDISSIIHRLNGAYSFLSTLLEKQITLPNGLEQCFSVYNKVKRDVYDVIITIKIDTIAKLKEISENESSNNSCSTIAEIKKITSKCI
ncbi:hypothetical protein QTN25_009149 [Entamoeba marina]